MIAYEIQIGALIAQHNLKEAVRAGLVVLSKLGVDFPSNPSKLQLVLGFLRVKMALRGNRIESLAGLPDMSDSMLFSQISIMRRLAKPVYMSTPNLLALMTFKQVLMLLRHGHTPYSPTILGSLGIVLCGVIGDIEVGYRLGRISLQLLASQPKSPFRGRTIFLFNQFIRHWKEHLQTTLSSLEQAYQLCLEAGDFEYATLSCQQVCQHMLLLGRNLNDTERDLTAYRRAILQLKQESTLSLIEIINQAVLNLHHGATDPAILIGAAFDEVKRRPQLEEAHDGTSLCYLHFQKLYLCILLNRYEEAAENAQLGLPYLDSARGICAFTRYHFYRGLADLRRYSAASPSERRKIDRSCTAIGKKFRKWARHAPMNHLHLCHVLDAERMRVRGKMDKAEKHYLEAVRLSKEHGYLNDEALSTELTAMFYLEIGSAAEGKQFMKDAHYKYLKWGALAKVSQLEAQYSYLTRPAE